MNTTPTDLGAITEIVNRSEHLLILTGAGISASAGLDTFRGTGAPPERLLPALHADTWAEHTDTLMRWWSAMELQLRTTEPTPAHLALAELEHRRSASGRKTAVLTQNIDGLHTRAGTRAVLEIHGSIERAAVDPRTGIPLPRPDVVFFGEQIHHQQLIVQLSAKADALLVIGTSGNVWPAAGLPGTVRGNGGRAALINMDPWPAMSSDFDAIALGAGRSARPGPVGPVLTHTTRPGEKI